MYDESTNKWSTIEVPWNTTRIYGSHIQDILIFAVQNDVVYTYDTANETWSTPFEFYLEMPGAIGSAQNVLLLQGNRTDAKIEIFTCTGCGVTPSDTTNNVPPPVNTSNSINNVNTTLIIFIITLIVNFILF